MSNRIKDAAAIERRLLELAHTTDAKITAPALAYVASCSIEDASSVLDDLTAHDRLSMEIEDDGAVVYHLLGRQKLAPWPQGAASGSPTALVPFRHAPPGPSPLLAAALSVLVPGAGHLYARRPGAAVVWFLVVTLAYALVIPGLVLHLFSIASAAATARRAAVASAPLQLAATAL